LRAALEGVNVVVHLSGENVGRRWAAARKERIRSSRVVTTRLLSETIARLRSKPTLLISASAIGIYGNRGDEVLTEASRPGDPANDFLTSVTLEWENAAQPARAAGVRVLHPRFGVVLSPDGGALQKLLLPFRLGLGGRIGDGRQWVSWISIDDAVGAVEHLLADDSLSDAVNVTAPEPVTNQELTRTLGRILSRPTPFRVPAWALRLVMGEMADSTLLASTRALPARLLASGYRFMHPGLESALRDMLARDQEANFPR
jgi:uncharacterized protein